MKTLLVRLDRILSVVLIALMSVLVLAIVWQVLSRYVAGAPSSVTEELARFTLIWTSLLGASYAFRHRMHLGLNLVTEKLVGKAKNYAEFTVLGVAAVFAFCILITGGGRLVLLTWELGQKTAVMGLPMALIYSAIPISGVLILFYAIDLANDLLSDLRASARQSDTTDDEGNHCE